MKKNHGLYFIARITIIYIFLALMSAIFYWYNRSTFGEISGTEFPELIKGFFKFSNANVGYTFGLFAAFSLFPFSHKYYSSRSYLLIEAILYILGVVTMTTTNLCDAVYFHFAGKRFTANEIFFLDNSNNTTILIQALKDNTTLIVTGLAIISLWVFLYFKLTGKHLKFRSRKFHYIYHTSIFLILVALIIVGMRGGIDRQTRPITISNAAQYSATPEKGSIILSNPFCILRTIENKAHVCPAYFQKSELSKMFSTKKDYSSNSITVKSQKGKNVIIFIMESFSAEHSKKLYPYLYANTLTPFLDSLMCEGYTMERAYANGKKSIDALPSILASIPSFETPFATLPESLASTDAIGNLAKKNGYSTWFFNGSERSSMGYVAYAKIAGIDNFRTKEDYVLRNGNNDFDGYWGIWDEPFFKYMANTLDSVNMPFLSVLFSLTSHHPFIVPDTYKKSLPKGYTKIHRPVAYVDLAMRHFFDYAKKRPWYKNTVFVFVADHVSSEKYGPESKTSVGGTHIMNFYFTPDGSLKGDIFNETQQIDIMPSLASLLEFKGPYHCFGNNIFSSKDSNSFAINYTGGDYQWIENDTSYIFNGDKMISAYDLKRDSLQKTNIVNNINPNIEPKIKAFIQTYYNEIQEKNFSIK